MLAARYVLAWCLLMLPGSGGVFAKDPACPAYEQLRPLLNSERIQACFGSYGVEVLEQQGNLRISSLYSLAADMRITRTLAISEFATDLPETLQTPYQAIRDGASMGATLEAAGWRVKKRNRYFGEVPVSTSFRCMSGLPVDSTQVLAVQVYDLWVLRNGQEVHFALLAELHDPRYLTLQDLQRIYPAMINELQPVDPASERLLQQAMRVCVAND